jgi:predicted small lipoprotein YifL
MHKYFRRLFANGVRVGVAFILLLTLSGCGQSGRLYLPPPSQDTIAHEKPLNH